jgi:hypothetical protein
MVSAIEGSSLVFGQPRIPGQFIVTRDAATAANIISNETLFRLGVSLTLISGHPISVRWSGSVICSNL